MVSLFEGGSTMMVWNRRSRAPSFSMYLRYSSSVVAPMHWISPRESAGLRTLRGVDGALGAAGADERVQLVNEEDDVPRAPDLVHDGLDALLELAAVFRARDHERQVEHDDPPVAQELRHVAADDGLGESLDDGGLADAGLAEQHGVVLGAAAEDGHHALDLLLAADDRVELLLAAPARSGRGRTNRARAS